MATVKTPGRIQSIQARSQGFILDLKEVHTEGHHRASFSRLCTKEPAVLDEIGTLISAVFAEPDRYGTWTSELLDRWAYQTEIETHGVVIIVSVAAYFVKDEETLGELHIFAWIKAAETELSGDPGN